MESDQDPVQDPVDLTVLAERLVRATTIVLAVVAIVLAAAVALDWTPVAAPTYDLTSDPAGELPF